MLDGKLFSSMLTVATVALNDLIAFVKAYCQFSYKCEILYFLFFRLQDEKLGFANFKQ